MTLKVATVVFVAAAVLSVVLSACGSNAPLTDPVAVTRALFDYINRGKAEAAAGLFADDGELVTGFGQPKGQNKIKTFFQTTVIPLKVHLEVKEINLSNGTMLGTFMMQDVSAFKTPTLMEVKAAIQDGRVKSMTWSVKK
jgi:hypothetical protein